MRVPVIERFRPSQVIIFTFVLFVAQIVAGTDLVFALLTAVYVFLWTLAYNLSGGLDYTSGAFIFFNGLFTVVLGLTYKALLFQPAERNLRSPRLTMLVYCMTMVGMMIAAFVNRGLRSRTPLFRDILSLEQMKHAAIACLILTGVFAVYSGSDLTAAGSVLSAVRQLNRFPLITIILATTYQIRKTNGRSSINWIVICGVLLDTGFGVIYFTKEGMLMGPTCWFITAMLNRFDFPKKLLVGAAAAVMLFSYYLVPYSQYVRLFATHTRTENLAVALHYLSDLGETRRLYFDTINRYEVIDEPHLFDQREGAMDRVVMLGPDDALIDYAGHDHIFGLRLMYEAYANVIPRAIWKNKPLATGSEYGRELKMIAEDDVTTGVSFSPAADAFAQAKWLGLMLLIPFQMFLAFIVTDSLVGSAKYSVWPILWIIEVSHLASEGGVEGPVYMISYAILSLGLLVWLTKTAIPFVMRTASGKQLQNTPALAGAVMQQGWPRLPPGRGASQNFDNPR